MWFGGEDKVSWVLIRHGRTEGNERRAYIGATDEPLSENGREQIESAAAAGFYPPVEMVFVSPMKRCRETAEIIYPHIIPEVVPGFRERDFGRLEGKTFEELQDDAGYMEWVRAGGHAPFPAGEPDEKFYGRIRAAFEDLWQNEKDRAVAVIAHGGTIMAIIDAFFSGKSFDMFSYRPENGDYYVVPELIKRSVADVL